MIIHGMIEVETAAISFKAVHDHDGFLVVVSGRYEEAGLFMSAPYGKIDLRGIGGFTVLLVFIIHITLRILPVGAQRQLVKHAIYIADIIINGCLLGGI